MSSIDFASLLQGLMQQQGGGLGAGPTPDNLPPILLTPDMTALSPDATGLTPGSMPNGKYATDIASVVGNSPLKDAPGFPTVPNPVAATPVVAGAPAPVVVAPAAPANGIQNMVNAGPGHPMDVRIAALNAEHNAQGIFASKDAKGQLVLSGGVPLAGTGQEGVAGSVRSILNQLKAATNIDTARGLQAQLNEAAAQESARIQQEAMTHAEAKIGVPAISAELSAAIAADHADPQYYPGRGDSPATANLRNQLNTARSAADLEAQRSMKFNVTQNGLDAALKTAGMETMRISRLADKLDAATALSDQRTQAKQDLVNFKLDEAAAGLSDSTQQNIRVLNPVLANASERDLAANFVKGKANPDYTAAITAPDGDLPKLAAEGNQFSATLLHAKESALGIKPAETDAKLKQLQEVMRSPTKLKQALLLVTPHTKDAQTAMNAQLADLNAKSMGSKEDKQLATAYRYEIAKQVVSTGLTGSYTSDVRNWNSNDPELNAAILQSKSVTGATDITNVAAAYIGQSTGPEARAKLDRLIAISTASAGVYAKSLFGMPDVMAIRNKLIADQLKKVTEAPMPGGFMDWKAGGSSLTGSNSTNKQSLFGAN